MVAVVEVGRTHFLECGITSFAASRVSYGTVVDHPRIQDLIDRMLALANAVDEVLASE